MQSAQGIGISDSKILKSLHEDFAQTARMCRLICLRWAHMSKGSGDDLYKLLAFYQILYHITVCDVYMLT